MTDRSGEGEQAKPVPMKRWVVKFTALIVLPPLVLGVTILVVVGSRIAAFRRAQLDPATFVEIDPDQVKAGKAGAITDRATFQGLLEPLKGASYFLPNHPQREEKYYLEVHRGNGRLDEYEVFLDHRGPEFDHVHVVRRVGTRTSYGSAFKTPRLRAILLAAWAPHRPPAK